MKYRNQTEENQVKEVAPHWGAWIEILLRPVIVLGLYSSHPTGVRGLKSVHPVAVCPPCVSHPTGVRGLK